MISHEALWQEFLASRDKALREQIAVQYGPLVRYVINSMSMMVPPLSTMDDALRAHEIVSAIERAADTGHTISL